MSEQSGPTIEQFEQAINHGIECALDEIGHDATQPRENPLSGEWADGIVPRDIAFNVGFKDEDSNFGEALNELADAWERGYHDTWSTHLSEKTGADDPYDEQFYAAESRARSLIAESGEVDFGDDPDAPVTMTLNELLALVTKAIYAPWPT